MEPETTQDSCASESENWCVKCSGAKVVCDWKPDLKVGQQARSPTFWHPGLSEWCVEAYLAERNALSVDPHLLSRPYDAPVEANLKNMLMWSNHGEAWSQTHTVTLRTPQKFKSFSWNVVEPDNFSIILKVSIPLNIPTSDALTREPRSLSSDLGSLLASGDGSDVVLFVADTELRAHRAVLSARSPVFAAMLRHDTREAQTGRVEAEDVEPEVLRELLRYIYTGSVPGTGQVAEQLLVAADKFGLVELKNSCEYQVANTLTVDKAAAAGVIALSHSCDVLKRYVVRFISKNLASVLQSDGWADVIRQNPELAIKLSRLIADEIVQ